jgi:OOP family OmpA-OmpF porin
MKRLFAALAIATLGAFASNAYAQAKPAAPAPQLTPWYVGGSLGMTSSDFCDDLGAPTCDDGGTGFKIFGGYQLNKNFAFELSYLDLGEAEASGGGLTVTGTASGFSLGALGILPIDNFSLFGRVGISFLDAEFKASGTINDSVSDSSNELTYGLGAAYNFTKNFAVRAEWERYTTKVEDEKTDIDLLTIGVTYRF